MDHPPTTVAPMKVSSQRVTYSRPLLDGRSAFHRRPACFFLCSDPPRDTALILCLYRSNSSLVVARWPFGGRLVAASWISFRNTCGELVVSGGLTAALGYRTIFSLPYHIRVPSCGIGQTCSPWAFRSVTITPSCMVRCRPTPGASQEREKREK